MEHPQILLQKFQMNGQVGRFGLVNPGHPSKIASIFLVLGTIEKKILSQAKKKLEAF